MPNAGCEVTISSFKANSTTDIQRIMSYVEHLNTLVLMCENGNVRTVLHDI